jgi:hypothetical protein
MSGITLKPDMWIKRENSRGARHEVVKPLTDAQKKLVVDTVGEYCVRSYVNRMKSSALMSDFDEDGDLVGDGWEFLYNILGKFDLSKCGPIAEFDIQGDDQPKSIPWYFKTYFSGRINFNACEARTNKKNRNVGGPSDIFQEITYDEEDTQNVSEFNHEYDITGFVYYELKKQEFDVQRMYFQLYKLGMSTKEVREEYGTRFNEINNKLKKMFEVIKKNYKNDWLNGKK